MGWRFRKSVRIFPGVRLNIGKRGLTSASVGPHGGAHLIVSKSGDVAVSVTPITGAGLSWRQKIGKIFGPHVKP